MARTASSANRGRADVAVHGRKGILDPEIAAMIEKLEPPVIKQMKNILLAAKSRAHAGELTLLTTY